MVSSVYALDCQYTEKEQYKDELQTYILNNETITTPGPKISITNIRKWKEHIGYYMNFEFRVQNNLNCKINTTVSYVLSGNLKSKKLIIDPKGYKTIKGTYHQDSGGLDKTSIKYVIHSPQITTSFVTKEKEVCKKCPPGSETVCLDDGKPASADEKCGSGKRNIKGICIDEKEPCYVLDDGICSPCSQGVQENCQNSPADCACQENYVCGDTGKCVPDCTNPPEGMDCGNDGEFRKINTKKANQPCDYDFECIEHYQNCVSNICQPEPDNPPKGKLYCPATNSFNDIQAIELGKPCKCDFECKQGICFQEKCQNIIEPKVRCPSGTSVKKGETLQCNIYGSNIKLNQDVKIIFELECGSGLSFSATQGCQQVKGSQCLGNYIVADLSNEGINVELNTISAGNSKLEGAVTFEYQGKTIKEPVTADFDSIYVYYCGNGVVDPGETKEDCCTDTGVEEYSFFKFYNEKCENNVFSGKFNWQFLAIIAIIVIGISLFGGRNFIRELTKLSKEKQQEIAKKIEKIEAEVRKKEKEIDIDKNLIKKLEYEKATEEEINIVKERIKESIKETEELRKQEKEAKDKFKQEKLTPYYNKDGCLVHINEKGYEVFHDSGKLFHRWKYKKHKGEIPKGYEIHHKNGKKRDNRIENLELLTKKEHNRKHGL